MKNLRHNRMSNSFLLIGAALFAFCLLTGGCAWRRPPLAGTYSSRKVDDIQGGLKVGMTFPEVIKLAGSAPILLENGKIHFILKDGDLWIQNACDYDQIERVVFWETKTNLPDGKSIAKTSQDTTRDNPLRDPLCIDLTVRGEYQGKPMTMIARHEDYGAGNALMEITNMGDGQVGSLFIVEGRYLLAKGDIPTDSVMDAVNGQSILANLLLYFLSQGLPKGPDSIKGKTNLKLGDKQNDLSLPLPSGTTFVYPAPWRAEGWAMPSATGEGIDFDIDFEFGNRAEEVHKQNLSGWWYREKKTLPDSMQLAEWKIFRITRDNGPVPLDEKIATLGKLRKK
jgi:hypothetical protein